MSAIVKIPLCQIPFLIQYEMTINNQVEITLKRIFLPIQLHFLNVLHLCCMTGEETSRALSIKSDNCETDNEDHTLENSNE